MVTIFEGQYVGACGAPNLVYDVSPDGQRFLMVKEGAVSRFQVVQNWHEELKRLVPVD